MRSVNNSAKWEAANGGQPVVTLLGQTGYSSSEDDEMTRLKPSGGTSTGSSSGHGCPPRGGRSGASKYLHNSNSEGATSPNESDNTYAEASLLPPQQRPPLRYGQYEYFKIVVVTKTF